MKKKFEDYLREQDSTEDLDILEKLASLGHDQWREWAQNLLNRHRGDLPEEVVERWMSYFVPYDKLDEKVKEKDRAWARRMLEVIRQG
ncbi:MAG: hypothetical protein KAS32_23150 [Candidatus Peribacteraceae bacterium]|nr:hypothetical protein [Candidatus Peribacteraceae bacterium]